MKPKAVLISDIHYNVNTLPLADASLLQAIYKANALDVPLIVAGDAHDSKANLRGECVNAIITTISKCNHVPYVIIGNHSRINEKSHEHSLNFLEKYAHIVNVPTRALGMHLIPYQYDLAALRRYLINLPKHSTLIMHQGIKGAHAGEYIQDKTAINKQDVLGHRVISGHYHNRQDIELGDDGLWTYIGNPYTLGFGEANDPDKGYLVLMQDNTVSFQPTNLRKHIIINVDLNKDIKPLQVRPEDLVWIKVLGTKKLHTLFPKDKVADMLGLTGMAFKYDLIVTDVKPLVTFNSVNQTSDAVFDSMIDSISDATNDKKSTLKTMWRGVLSDTE